MRRVRACSALARSAAAAAATAPPRAGPPRRRPMVCQVASVLETRTRSVWNFVEDGGDLLEHALEGADLEGRLLRRVRRVLLQPPLDLRAERAHRRQVGADEDEPVALQDAAELAKVEEHVAGARREDGVDERRRRTSRDDSRFRPYIDRIDVSVLWYRMTWVTAQISTTAPLVGQRGGGARHGGGRSGDGRIGADAAATAIAGGSGPGCGCGRAAAAQWLGRAGWRRLPSGRRQAAGAAAPRGGRGGPGRRGAAPLPRPAVDARRRRRRQQQQQQAAGAAHPVGATSLHIRFYGN